MAFVSHIEESPELIYELIITIINVMSILTNVLLIVVISRTKIMRTRTNMYILNVAVADLLTLSVLLIYYVDKRAITISENRNYVQCVLTNLELSLQIVTVLFVTVLTVNCLINTLSQNTAFILLWNLILVLFYVNFQYCQQLLSFSLGVSYVGFLAVLMLIIFMKYIARCRNKGDVSRDGAFRLNFATIFTCLCLASWIVNIIAAFTFRNDSIFKHFILAFGTSVKVGKNIALACYLFRFNETFKNSLMAVFNCKTIRINESVNYSTDQTSIDMNVSIRDEKHYVK